MGSFWITPTVANHLLNLIHASEQFKDDIIYHAKKLLYKVINRFNKNLEQNDTGGDKTLPPNHQ
jgi:hypothetical protein